MESLDPPELRAVWVDAFHDGFKTPQQVDELVAWARSANLNALFVQVRRRGDAYYLKSFEPRTEDPDLAPGFDALQYLLDKAHQSPQRLQVHAWLATLPAWWQRDTPPDAPNHVFNVHGLSAAPMDSWLMYRDDGTAWAGVGSSGIYYLDPGNPAAQAYTTDVYLNLLRNYDVDGIHLDQVRYYEGDALRWLQPDQRCSVQRAFWPRSRLTAGTQRFGLDRLAARSGHRVGSSHLHTGEGDQAQRRGNRGCSDLG
jgi:uncharacterized lipoprotein YddW (UPF0748 family)